MDALMTISGAYVVVIAAFMAWVLWQAAQS